MNGAGAPASSGPRHEQPRHEAIREDQRREAQRLEEALRAEEAGVVEPVRHEPTPVRQEEPAVMRHEEAVVRHEEPVARHEEPVREETVRREEPRIDSRALLESSGLVMIETDHSKSQVAAPAEEPQHLGRPRRERPKPAVQEEELQQVETRK
jgi:hypothetical protein